MENKEQYVLSQTARQALRRAGIAATVEVKICKHCKKSADQIPKDVVHPSIPQLIQARAELVKDRRNITLQRQYNLHSARLVHRSRCCGFEYQKSVFDNHMGSWKRWKTRFEILTDHYKEPTVEVTEDRTAQPPKTVKKAITMEILRRDLGTSPDVYDDDFVLMSFLTGSDNSRVRELLKIFRAEEQRQAEYAQQQENQQNIASSLYLQAGVVVRQLVKS